MKEYIDGVMNDLKNHGNKDCIPNVPEVPTDGKTVFLDPPKAEVVEEDLSNQVLSKDPEEAVKQLDFQAQQSEQKQTIG